MKVPLNLKPEVESALEADAHASGMSLQECLLSVVEEAATQADSFRHRSVARRVAQTGSPIPLQAGNSQKRSAKVQCRCSSSTKYLKEM
jgi:hypothetical protein